MFYYSLRKKQTRTPNKMEDTDMALLDYTFDTPVNPGLNRTIDFYNGYLAYKKGMQELHNRLNKVKKYL